MPENVVSEERDQVSAKHRVVPIYEQLVGYYRNAILTRRFLPEERFDSISRITQEHAVSRETAKRVMAVLAEEGLIVRRQGKGTFVANLKPMQKVWGFVFPFWSSRYDDLLVGLRALAAIHGRELRHFYDGNNWEEEIRFVASMLNDRYEAIIVIPTLDQSKTADFYSKLSPEDSPVILFDYTMSGESFPYVIQSYDVAVARALSYLMEKTDGAVAYVGHELWSGSRHMVLEVMQETYIRIVNARRPDFQPIILGRSASVTAEDIRANGVTGIFCPGDESSVQIIGHLKDQGVDIPGEVNLVSYGNTDIARYFTPGITSLDPHNERMIACLEELLAPHMQGKPLEARHFMVQPDLVIRDT
jgi:DNA-binding LacI/PurR family transcriptional regulator